jgi:hypothetical protein
MKVLIERAVAYARYILFNLFVFFVFVCLISFTSSRLALVSIVTGLQVWSTGVRIAAV